MCGGGPVAPWCGRLDRARRATSLPRSPFAPVARQRVFFFQDAAPFLVELLVRVRAYGLHPPARTCPLAGSAYGPTLWAQTVVGRARVGRPRPCVFSGVSPLSPAIALNLAPPALPLPLPEDNVDAVVDGGAIAAVIPLLTHFPVDPARGISM